MGKRRAYGAEHLPRDERPQQLSSVLALPPFLENSVGSASRSRRPAQRVRLWKREELLITSCSPFSRKDLKQLTGILKKIR